MKRNWFACELHCHTLHSDGAFTPRQLVQTARERLLDGIALTDHNTFSGVPEAQQAGEIAVLPGMEITSFYGHMPVLGIRDWVEWRDLSPRQGDLLLQRAKKAGRLAGIAHPFQLGTPICTGGHWDYTVRDMSRVDYIEIFSEGCPYLNSPNRRAIAFWHDCLDAGLHPAPTMGRDWHRPENNALIAACTYLGSTAERITPEVMLAAVEKGRTVVSAGPRFSYVCDGEYTAGDTVKSGSHRFLFDMDYTRFDRLCPSLALEVRELRAVTNGGEIACRIPLESRPPACSLDLRTKPGGWYSFELWGKIGDKESQLIAVTAALYSV